MEITVNITVPDDIYHFYAGASNCIHGSTPEDVISDALAAYARMLSGEISGQHPSPLEGNPGPDTYL